MFDLDVAVPTPLPQTFTYAADSAIAAGTRVLVPFGNRRLVGVVLGPGRRDHILKIDPTVELKRIEAVIDDLPVYSPVVLEIARWIAGYYLHPIGEVLRTMLPASATKVVEETYVLTPIGLEARQDGTGADGTVLAHLFRKKTELTVATLKSKLKKLDAGPESVFGKVTLRGLVKAGLLTKTRGTSMRARGSDDDAPAEFPPLSAAASLEQEPKQEPEVPPDLTPRQQDALTALVEEGLKAPAAPKPFLLLGVTGAGKTEVYLRLIAACLAHDGADSQALVMVPEISLTPQMTRVFERRFPGQVAVVHSAMSDPERWAAMQRIRHGEARILIGPRSSVFGPFRKLRLLLVDEEHDGSYKQSTGLSYSGRDVAVVRAKLERATIVLGSATPSMESYNNALTGRYRLLELPERVSGRPLPSVSIIENLERAKGRGKADEIPIDPRIVEALKGNLALGRQAIVLVNRRGYAYYLFSLEKKKAVQCPQCSISLTLHARSTVLRCHYCDYSTTSDKLLRERPDETFLAVGYGSQKAEDCVRDKVPGARVVRLDSDSVTKKDFLPKTLAKFRRGEIDILVGTQILAKGHDFPKVTLIAILEVDQLLDLPDFRAGERTFQLIVQAAGRAGRAELPGEVMIQTMRAGHPVVGTAILQDYKAFAQAELKFRSLHQYPPFARMIAIESNSEDRDRINQLARQIEAWVEQMATMRPELLAKVRVLGPAIPPIETIRRRHRRSLIFSSALVEPLRQLTQQFLSTFSKLPNDVRLKIDVDPQSLI